LSTTRLGLYLSKYHHGPEMNFNEWRSRSVDIDFRENRRKTLAILPGIAFCMIAVCAAGYVSEHYGGPVILLALLLGMAFNRLYSYQEYIAGVDFCARSILKLGIALLGVRITSEEIIAAGHLPLTVVLVLTLATFLFSMLAAKVLKVSLVQALISGAAVAICGISAALAVAMVLPQNKANEQYLLCTVAGVAGISTLAMVLYPALASQLGFSPYLVGVFLGATIHDVAQVAGAGYMISAEVGDLATYTKMIRVAALVPLVILFSLWFKTYTARLTPPLFLCGFVILAIISGANLLPELLIKLTTDASGICLLTAMAALGCKTDLVKLTKVGLKPLLLLVGNTVFIAACAIILLGNF
jgi:uncharacterized integral membrane protein (TIGR00698 family)